MGREPEDTGYRVAWEMLKSGMQPDFRVYVDELAADVPPISASNRLAVWKRLIAEQRAGAATP